MTFIKNMFHYGEVGDRCNGNRTSEISINSLKFIKNMTVTDIGTLKFAKQFTTTDLILVGTIVKIINTSKNYYVVLTTSNLYTILKSNDTINSTISHTMGNSVDMSVLGNNRLCLYNGVDKLIMYSIDVSSLTPIPTFKIKYPIKNKRIVQLDLWSFSADPANPGKLRVTQMASFTNPLIRTTDGVIYLYNSSLVIKRIYTNYAAVVDREFFTGATAGDVYGVLRVFEKVDTNNKYIVDNTIVTVGSLILDPAYGGYYFTSLTGNGEGEFSFGELVNNIDIPDKVGFFQDRMIIDKNGYLYFSKIREYDDFKNSTSDDSAFFLQLNPIRGTNGKINGFVTGELLYILTTNGIYAAGGTNFLLTAANAGSGITQATDMTTTNNFELSNNILYFYNNNGVLKSLELNTSSLQLSFITQTVDKYSTKKLFKEISKTIIDDKEYILARGNDDDTMFLIEQVESGIFRKVRLDFIYTGKIHALDDRFIMGSKVYKVSDVNYKQGTIEINPLPFNGNDILLDNASRISKVSIKMINEELTAVEGVKIGGKNIQNITNDIYNIYKLTSSFSMGTGLVIDIFTNENNKVCELLSVQLEAIANRD